MSLSWRLLSGLVSSSLSALLTNPADVVLIRMQADGAWPLAQRRGYRHALHGLSSVWRSEGATALYRGSGPTALRAALVTMAQLPTYEELKGDLEEKLQELTGRMEKALAVEFWEVPLQ